MNKTTVLLVAGAVLASLSISLLLFSGYNESISRNPLSDTAVNEKENLSTTQSDVLPIAKASKERSQHALDYKEIFKEPENENDLQHMIDAQHLKKIDEEVEALIEEAEKRIAQKHLELPVKMDAEKEKRLAEAKKELENLERQLERLYRDEK